jgi:hypothetical protein
MRAGSRRAGRSDFQTIDSGLTIKINYLGDDARSQADVDGPMCCPPRLNFIKVSRWVMESTAAIARRNQPARRPIRPGVGSDNSCFNRPRCLL